MNHNHFKRILPVAIVALFLACEGNFKEITDEERQARLSQSSSSAKQSSSSGETLSSSSSEASSSSTSSSSEALSSSSSEASSSSALGDDSSSSESLCAGFDESDKFCDERDGKKYRYVTIGTQTWMAQNLNYADFGSCYYHDDWEPEPGYDCSEYGRLYDWKTALNACPEGWKLPEKNDWQTLINFVEAEHSSSSVGEHLKATNQCSGSSCSDTYNFSALMGGYRNENEKFTAIGISGYWWSATAKDTGDADDAYHLVMNHNDNDVTIRLDYKTLLFSVRCVKDEDN